MSFTQILQAITYYIVLWTTSHHSQLSPLDIKLDGV